MPFPQPPVPENLIEETRQAFLKELENKGDSVIHPKDLEKIKKDDFYIKRFLMHHDANQKGALEMMWETVQWRKDFGTNDLTEDNLKMDLLLEGIFFTPGRDRDGHPLFVFKCKKHTKGKSTEEIKKIVVYWIDKIEKEEKGNPMTLFFDMDGCGLSNMDLEIVKYLISLFKQYYPYSLNYIIIYEMQWILNAAFKVIKTWLPEKALERLRVIKKPELSEFVDPDQALQCWGGNNDYVFNFVPQQAQETTQTNPTSRKVHFADGSAVIDTSSGDLTDTGMLSVTPSNAITFNKEGSELISTVELKNIDEKSNLSYKMKTTSPEKFKVRPSAGILTPGSKVKIHVTLLPGFQLGGLSKDKFLVMSMPIENTTMSQQELADLWKNASGKQISQHRLRCVQVNETMTKNGSAVLVTSSGDDNAHLTQITARLSQLGDCQKELHHALKRSQMIQWLTLFFVFVIGALLAYNLRSDPDGYCYRNDDRDLD